MERNLGSAKDVGLCVMFPVVPLMTFLSACRVEQVDWLCGTQSSGLSGFNPFLILHNFCVLEQVPQLLSASSLGCWEDKWQSWRLLNPVLTGILYMHYVMSLCEFYPFSLIHVPAELHFTQNIFSCFRMVSKNCSSVVCLRLDLCKLHFLKTKKSYCSSLNNRPMD